jgi:hypothetical protein
LDITLLPSKAVWLWLPALVQDWGVPMQCDWQVWARLLLSTIAEGLTNQARPKPWSMKLQQQAGLP